MLDYDLKITGGRVIDGTGKPGFLADVAVKDGRIVAVGDCPGTATRTLDATGALVTPGFVDIHTHYDGQVSWDEELAPSCLHGVTTVAMGSCGVGFAPVRREDHDRLIALMEGVEDIPGTALAEGITWGWESFPEYMACLDAMPHTLDFLFHVPHDALRVYVMGERAIAGGPATDEDIAEMRRLVREALDAGAVGFSTGRSDNHRSATGDFTPASEAEGRELAGIAEAFVGLDHGVLQAVNDFNILDGNEHFEREWAVLQGMVEAAGGRPMSVSCMQRDHSPQQWQWIFEKAEKAQQQGIDVRCQVAPRGIGVLLGLQATFHPFMGHPTYKAMHDLPLADRVARMKDPAVKAQMLTEEREPVGGDGSPLPKLADFFLENIEMLSMRLFRMAEDPNYEPGMMDSLAAEAMHRDEHVMSVIYDALLEDGGEALIYFPVYNYSNMNLNDVGTMLRHPLALPGLSDGGAHVGTICDASFPTFMLTHWGRDRAEGRLPIERLVQMQTADTADFIGLQDRGRIAVGLKADLNIIDLNALKLLRPELQRDLPAGGRRLMQRAEGYRATIVSGEVVVQDGVVTDARPGRWVRSGAS